jgi:hypothetical protein
MMMHLMPYHKKFNMMGETFPIDSLAVSDDPNNGTYYPQGEFKNATPVILTNESITIQMPFLSGLFNCGKYLPLKYLQGLSIELILVSHHTDAALKTWTNQQNNEEPLWTITEPVIKCQVIMIDNALQNGFTQRLLDGRSFPIHFTSFVTQIANSGNTSTPVVSITRAFTRLKAAYITMFKRIHRYDPAGETEEAKYRGPECQHLANAKEATMFYHPQYVYNGVDARKNISRDKVDQPPQGTLAGEAVRGYYHYNPKCEVSYQIQLGSRVFPIMEVKTSQEAFYELLKTIGCHELSSTYAVDILPREYRSWKYIIGVSFENAPGSSFSGVSTRNGDLLTIKLKGTHHVNHERFDSRDILPYSYPEYIYVVLEADMVVSVSDVGVKVFD